MTAYKCDICGAFYEENGTVSINGKASGEVRFRTCLRGETIHWCPTCVGIIQEIVDARKGINDKGD